MDLLPNNIMEVEIILPSKKGLKVIEREFPDICEDVANRYFVGRSFVDPLTDDRGKAIEWLTYNEAVECCGFVEGAIPGSETLIEGNGGWAQGMISRRDFSSLAVSASEKRAYKRTSDRFWRAFRRGQAAAKKDGL